MTGNNIFVFIVCGAREHIDTLHYTLKPLRHFSKNRIIVLTDSLRNEIPIEWNDIVDVKAPEHFDNHQASIYLKTGVHKFLPSGNNYCYLDTDVIAMSEDVDDIFAQKNTLITFAPDHCRMAMFSPYAVKCGCYEKNQQDLAELDALQTKYDHLSLSIKDPVLKHKQKMLLQQLQIIRQNKLGYLLLMFKYFLSPKVFSLGGEYFYHRWKKYWTDAEGNPILYDNSKSVIGLIEKNSKWRWNPIRKRWIGPNGEDVHHLVCEHLPAQIKVKFAIDVKDTNWQHWNGGVFLFNDESHPFLEAWHNKTMDIFTDPAWRTRDQGTLIATAWEFGMDKAPLLSKRFNFIADYYNPRLMLGDGGNTITDDAFATDYKPAFIHIYHHFGNNDWDLWNWVDGRVQQAIDGSN